MTIKELREKRAAKWNDAKNFLDTHRDENGMLSASDDAAYSQIENELDGLDKEIKRLEKLENINKQLGEPTSSPLLGKPNGATKKEGRASDEYRKDFWNVIRNKPTVSNALQVGTDSEGGYLVPDEFEKKLIDGLTEQNIMRKYATVIKTAYGERKIPIVASHGSASWVDEEGTIPESDDAFTQVSLGAHKLGRMIKVSEELLNDAVFDLESYIAAEYARSFGVAEEEAFITGNGTGKPLGLTAATGGAGVGVTAASQTAITADELIDLFHSVKKPYRKNAVWLLNDATIKLIRKLKDSQGNYLWQPGLKEGQPDLILGRPVETVDAMPTVAAGAKSVIFGDLSYYWIADRQSRTFKRLGELYAATGQVGFRATQRVDGKLILTEAVKALVQANA